MSVSLISASPAKLFCRSLGFYCPDLELGESSGFCVHLLPAVSLESSESPVSSSMEQLAYLTVLLFLGDFMSCILLLSLGSLDKKRITVLIVENKIPCWLKKA